MSGEIEEIFKRNRLTERSPEKKIETEEEGAEEWRKEIGDRI